MGEFLGKKGKGPRLGNSWEKAASKKVGESLSHYGKAGPGGKKQALEQEKNKRGKRVFKKIELGEKSYLVNFFLRGQRGVKNL